MIGRHLAHPFAMHGKFSQKPDDDLTQATLALATL